MLIVCSKCQGEGTVSRVHEKVYFRTALCDTCGGSGKVVEGAKTPEPRNGYVADSPEPVVAGLNDSFLSGVNRWYGLDRQNNFQTGHIGDDDLKGFPKPLIFGTADGRFQTFKVVSDGRGQTHTVKVTWE